MRLARRLGMTTVSAALIATATLVLASCGSPASSGPGASESPGEGTPSPSGPGASESPNEGTPTPSGPSPSADLAEQLAGRDFESTSVEGYQVADGSTLTIGFSDDGEVGGSAGCNAMGDGEPVWQGDELTVTGGAVTAMGCEQPLMTQEQWWFALLADGVHVALDGDELTFSSPDADDQVTVHLIDSHVAHPDSSLQDTTWRLDGIISGTGDDGSVSSVPDGVTATLRIEDEHLDVYDGRGWFVSPDGNRPVLPSSVDGDIVHVPNPPSKPASNCSGEQHDCVDMSMLGHDFFYEISADTLTVTGMGITEGQGLMFVADDDLRGWPEG